MKISLLPLMHGDMQCRLTLLKSTQTLPVKLCAGLLRVHWDRRAIGSVP